MRINHLLIATIAIAIVIILPALCCGTAVASAVVNVSAGYSHTVVLSDDGTVRTWGEANSQWGILGTGNYQGGSLRTLDGLPAIVAIDAEFRTSLAIDREGRVWAWGDNTYGQCGNSASTTFPSPVQVDGLANIVQVSSGGINSAAVDRDGHVWTWGDNKYGQLGTGRAGGARYEPKQVDIDNVKMVTAGNGYMVVLKNDGTVWAWGENKYGMSGSGGEGNVLFPQQIEGLSDIVAIDAGYDHTLALRDDGTVWGWGNARENKLCNGQGYKTPVAVRTPVKVKGLPFIVDIAAGGQGSLVLDRDGSAWAWGSNGDGQYGNGIDLWEPAQAPVKVPGLDGVVSISAGYGHCVAIRNDGAVWAWGRNLEDQIQPGIGRKAMTPLKIIEGGGTTVVQQPTIPAASATGSAGSEIAVYIAAGGVIMMALAIIGAIVLLRLRK